MYTKHANAKPGFHSFIAHGKLVDAVILIRVGDIIYVGHRRGRGNFEPCVNFFIHGEWGELQVCNPLVFCGIEVQLFQGRHITMSRE